MRARFTSLFIVVFAAVVGMGQTGGGEVPVEATPIVESAHVHAGDTVRVALRVHLPAGFHAQSNQPRDPTLIPTSLALTPPPGVSTAEIVFPKSTDLRQAGVDQPLAVFAGDFVIGVRLALAGSLPLGPVSVPARFRFQVCNDTTCFRPRNIDIAWTMDVAPAATPLVPEHQDVFAGIAFGHGEAPLVATAPAPASVTSTQPSNDAKKDDLARLDDFTVLGTAGGYMNSAEFLQFVHNAEAGVKTTGMFEGHGPLAILLIVFLGGLALNFTPCVLPMIPINLAIIGAGVQSGHRGRGFWLGAAYGGAMALVYGVIGLVVILTAGSFGSINASPWFNLGIAALFVFLGLAMFDVVIIDFTRFSTAFKFDGANRGTFVLAFSMGAVAALLAGACVAPVVIQVVLFSSNLYATGTPSALALPFLLGVGMATPWPFAGAGLASLPKPGAWMVRVKQAFGVFILATAAYYGYEAYGIFANRWVDAASVTSSVEEKVKAGWHASLAEGLAASEQTHQPVLIDLWATWCKNCLTMDKTTLEDPAVTSALADYTKIKFQAEDPDASPAKEIMRRFNAVGLPAYVILKPKTATAAR